MAEYYRRYSNEDGSYTYLPATSVEYVVHCEDCSYFDPVGHTGPFGYCGYLGHLVEETDFCSEAVEENKK